ncbi:MAG TPA: YidC/Oxa1 family membrane protein insertase, partial [Solirubrobacterales bacterium]|nr:YidC/Oxa1 family membrane protein insertase [Solirubrobacterales bacterium]
AGLSWGMSIIALTICTRALLIPLTYRSLKGMRALQALQPQLKEIKEKYKNDQKRMQQEMMHFYQENKVNPFASCIPLLAQLPVFITLFYVLKNELPADIGCKAGECGGEASFLFISDLTAKAHGGELIALLILYVGTQLISGLVMAVTADKSQRMMMLVLPFVFVPFVISFPAGLVLYWITTNIWTIGQQYTIQKLIPAPQVATPAEVAAAKPPPKPPKKKKRRR